MSRTKPTLALLVALGVAVGLLALRTREEAAAQPKPDAADTNEDAQAIRRTGAAIEAAFNKADLDALMAHWAPDAEYTDEEGARHKGADKIRALFKKSFEENKGAKMSLIPKALKFLRPDVAIADGANVLTPPDGPPESGEYIAVWVKTDNKWLLASVRDLPATVPEDLPASERLKELEWMIGEWVSDDATALKLTIAHAPNKVAVLYEITLKKPDGQMATVNGRIGYDAAADSLRVWTFDSLGGFSGGFGVREGNSWIVDNEGVLPDGRIGTSIDTYRYVNDTTFVFESKNRSIDEQPIPDAEVKFVRKAAPEGSQK